MALNRRTGRFYQSGSPIVETVGGVTAEQLEHVLRHSSDAEEAATHIERIVLGKEMLPMDIGKQAHPGADQAQNNITLNDIERLITARVANETVKIIEPIQKEMQEALNSVRDLASRLTETITKMQRKPGRPPKNKSQEAANQPAHDGSTE